MTLSTNNSARWNVTASGHFAPIADNTYDIGTSGTARVRNYFGSGNITVGGSVAATGAVTGSNLSGTNTGDQVITLTNDVTGTGTGSFAATISAGAVSLSKMANLAANSIIGNNTGAAATPIALSPTQLKALLAIAATDVSGLAAVATSGSSADITPNIQR
jgi:hypothetical protein